MYDLAATLYILPKVSGHLVLQGIEVSGHMTTRADDEE
jgi:hypothetical protein